MASPDYQVGALFEALDEGVLMVPLKSIGFFPAISSCHTLSCHLIDPIRLQIEANTFWLWGPCLKVKRRWAYYYLHYFLLNVAVSLIASVST